jgi:hypothetical protein
MLGEMLKSATKIKQSFKNSSYSINPLTPDLNPPAQRQPAEVFKFGIQFLTLTLRKKNYLIHFSFKFQEIKFCSVFMN